METRILIVDDDPFICGQLQELYASQRYVVDTAANAAEGAAPAGASTNSRSRWST